MYTCPMHPDVQSDKPGRCPKCGMKLVNTKNQEPNSKQTSDLNAQSYKPLIIIIGLILLVSVFVSYVGGFHLKSLIQNFMIGFFLVFSGFKLVDLSGFAQGYSTYDILAKRIFAYGYIYPFIELIFGLLMIISLWEQQVLIVEVIVMTFSGLGVALKLARHERFQCVCLGTFLKVPLTKVTLIEDFGMAALALLLLIWK